MSVAATVILSLLGVLAFCLGSCWLLRKHTVGQTKQDSLRNQIAFFKKNRAQAQVTPRADPAKRHKKFTSAEGLSTGSNPVAQPAETMSAAEYNEL